MHRVSNSPFILMACLGGGLTAVCQWCEIREDISKTRLLSFYLNTSFVLSKVNVKYF